MTSGLWAVALILAVLAVFAAALAVNCRQQGDVDRRLSAAALVARADAQQAAIMRGDLMVGLFGDYPPAAPFDKEWQPAPLPLPPAYRAENAAMKAPGSVNDNTYVLYLEGGTPMMLGPGSIFNRPKGSIFLEPPPGTYRTRIDLGGLTQSQYGSPLFGGDSSHGVNTVDVWIKQPDTGGPAVFEAPYFVPSFNSGASYTFEWKDGQTPTLSTVPGAIDVIKLSSANFSNWVGKHYAAPAWMSWDDISGKPAVIAAGATQAEARAAIGAGTSNLVLGTTSTTEVQVVKWGSGGVVRTYPPR